jgi:7-keto-8-aminopelargonate synthetase-like enzyme
MRGRATSFAPAHTVAAAERSVSIGAAAGVIMQSVDDVPFDGRHATIRGNTLLNFGSCSYLGLEQRAELKRGAIEATEKFGTQFSYSRGYLELPLYAHLETAVSEMTGGYALIAPTTTLAHVAALPVLVGPDDAVIIDQSAHASLHTAIALLHSIPVSVVRHNRMDRLEAEIARLSASHRHVWFVGDGLYSMLGDLAPLDGIAVLLEKYPQLHLYVDDAHSTSWTGRNGRGHALERLPDVSRVVVALGFAKAFGVGGAALVFANDEDRQRVRRCGGPMLFSGPLQPPLLGAAVASARLHLDPSFAGLQRALLERIDLVLSLAEELDVPLASRDKTPIFFVRCGPLDVAFDLVLGLRARGIYVCCSGYPAVPQNQAGARFTLSLLNSHADIRYFMLALAEETKRLGIVERRSPVRRDPSSAVITRARRTSSPPPPGEHPSQPPPP